MEICAYCGEKDPATRDHIPPKNLFGKPLPNDLITVPCCKKCHEDTSKDDEYFRSVVVSWEALDGIPEVEAARDSVIRSLMRKESAGFAKTTIASISEISILKKSGCISKQTAMEIDYFRIERVLERVTRGLFYKETGKVVDKNMQVKVKVLLTLHEQLIQKLQQYGNWDWRSYANNNFNYAYLHDAENKMSSTWLFDIFGKFSAIGTIRP